MAVDIYLRNSEDPTYEEKRTDIGDDLDMFLQQIEMVLLTPKTAVLGLPDFGTSLDLYLWEFNVSESQLENEVSRQIQEYCALSRKFQYNVSVQIFNNDFKDTAIVDISINGAKLLGLSIK